MNLVDQTKSTQSIIIDPAKLEDVIYVLNKAGWIVARGDPIESDKMKLVVMKRFEK